MGRSAQRFFGVVRAHRAEKTRVLLRTRSTGSSIKKSRLKISTFLCLGYIMKSKGRVLKKSSFEKLVFCELYNDPKISACGKSHEGFRQEKHGFRLPCFSYLQITVHRNTPKNIRWDNKNHLEI